VDGAGARVRVLARRVAELHVALARRTGDAAFDPEPVDALDLRRWTSAVHAECLAALDLLEQHRGALHESAAALAQAVLGARATLLARIERAGSAVPVGLKTRLHGDLNLQQVLVCRDDFVIVGFEGAPSRPLAERRAKHSALRDLAAMLRSFDYARESALLAVARAGARREMLAPVARRWERGVREAFVGTYREVVVAGALYRPAEFDAALALLELFEIEKAFDELRHEIDNRPDWIGVPLAGLAAFAGITP
jgi:maltose alpha-D-glucosyltransferase/alpha-amylase